MVTRPKPERCAICQRPIVQRVRGRARQVCPARNCQRQANALRRRLQRRRAVGLPSDDSRHEQNRSPAPRGGHDSLLRRFARQLAARSFAYTAVTAEELNALESALQAGAVTTDDINRLARGHSTTAYPPLDPVSAETQARLQDLIERNAKNDPTLQRHRELMTQLRNDQRLALRVFGTTNEALLAQLTMQRLRSDPEELFALLTTDDQAEARLEDAGLLPDGQGAWVRRR
jgi:hypothetical protein